MSECLLIALAPLDTRHAMETPARSPSPMASVLASPRDADFTNGSADLDDRTLVDMERMDPAPESLSNVVEDSNRIACPCGSEEDAGFMLACDGCNTWQHGSCVGVAQHGDVPQHYYCPPCKS